MEKNYTQRASINGEWVNLNPRTVAEQVKTDANRQFVSAAEKADYAGKQDALGYTPEDAAKKNQPEGYAGLDANGKLEETLLPDTLVHDKGFFATPEALREAHPAANAGDHAVVGTTDTLWVWDAELTPEPGWIDSGERAHIPLSSEVNSESEENAATSKAVKTVMDEAKSRAKITVGDTAPEDAQEGDFWFDTSDTPDSASDAQEEKAPPSAE